MKLLRKVRTAPRDLKVSAAVVAVVAGSLMIGIPVLATPGSGFAPTPLSKGLFGQMDVKADKTGQWDLFLKTKASSDLGVDQLAVAAGGYSGWHSHAGATFITVTSGEITWLDGPGCSSTTYHAGEGFVEPANHVHQVRNNTGAPATIVAVQIRPSGTPGRIDAPAPTNCN